MGIFRGRFGSWRMGGSAKRQIALADNALLWSVISFGIMEVQALRRASATRGATNAAASRSRQAGMTINPAWETGEEAFVDVVF